MDAVERVLDERSGDLREALGKVGFTEQEACRFLDEAGPEILRSLAWNAATAAPTARPGPEASDVLATVSGRTISSRAGLPHDKTWAGLRRLVPAVLAASGAAAASVVAGGRGGASSPASGREAHVTERFDVGFGLSLHVVRPTGGRPEGAAGVHPLFGRRRGR